MAGLTRDQYDQAAAEIRAAWGRADSRDAGLQVIVEFGRKYGYKNVIAALQHRLPKQFERGTPVATWLDERRSEEARE